MKTRALAQLPPMTQHELETLERCLDLAIDLGTSLGDSFAVGETTSELCSLRSRVVETLYGTAHPPAA